MYRLSYKTKTNNYITQFIMLNPDHGFTVAELFVFFKDSGFDVHKTTIYRNLEKRVAAGTLTKTKSTVSAGYMYHSVSGDTQNGKLHFRCSECGRVYRLNDDQTTAYLRSISNNFGFLIDLTVSSLYGLCQKCCHKG